MTDVSAVRYTYKPHFVSGAEFKLEIPTYAEDRSLTVDDRHGIRIIFVQSGIKVMKLRHLLV